MLEINEITLIEKLTNICEKFDVRITKLESLVSQLVENYNWNKNEELKIK